MQGLHGSARGAWVLGALLALLTAGCTGGGAPEEEAPPTITEQPSLSPNDAGVRIYLHDFPLDGHEVSKVLIDLQRVTILDEAGSEYVVNDEPQEVDLLTLVGGVTRLIGFSILPPGDHPALERPTLRIG